MASEWSLISGSSVFSHTTTPPVSGAITPAVGDLLIVGWCSTGLLGSPSSSIVDTGSGGWTSFVTIGATAIDAGDSGMVSGWWKIATSADFNSGLGITITITGSTGSTQNFTGFECDVFRLTTPSDFGGQDLAATFAGTVDVTAQSYSPGAGSTHSSANDELAWSLVTGLNPGAITGTNTFTGTSSATALAATGLSTNTNLTILWTGNVQASTTAGTNVFQNTWTNSRIPLLAGGTFWHAGGSQQVMIV